MLVKALPPPSPPLLRYTRAQTSSRGSGGRSLPRRPAGQPPWTDLLQQPRLPALSRAAQALCHETRPARVGLLPHAQSRPSRGDPADPHLAFQGRRASPQSLQPAPQPRLGRVGHLWVRRYYAAPMDRDHFLAALRYVDRNPVRAPHDRFGDGLRVVEARGRTLSGDDPSGVLDMALWRAHVDATPTGARSSEALDPKRRKSRPSARNTEGPRDWKRVLSARYRTSIGPPLASRKGGRPRKKQRAATAVEPHPCRLGGASPLRKIYGGRL